MDIQMCYEKKQKYEFFTEYDPPIPGLINISKQYPNIKFTLEYQQFVFEDCKLAMVGRIKFQDGEMDAEEERKVRVVSCPPHIEFNNRQIYK